MKISEFIERFNELDMPYGETHYKVSAAKEESFAHGVVINVFKNNKFEVTAARLPEGVNAWDFYGGAPFSLRRLLRVWTSWAKCRSKKPTRLKTGTQGWKQRPNCFVEALTLTSSPEPRRQPFSANC